MCQRCLTPLPATEVQFEQSMEALISITSLRCGHMLDEWPSFAMLTSSAAACIPPHCPHCDVHGLCVSRPFSNLSIATGLANLSPLLSPVSSQTDTDWSMLVLVGVSVSALHCCPCELLSETHCVSPLMAASFSDQTPLTHPCKRKVPLLPSVHNFFGKRGGRGAVVITTTRLQATPKLKK